MPPDVFRLGRQVPPADITVLPIIASFPTTKAASPSRLLFEASDPGTLGSEGGKCRGRTLERFPGLVLTHTQVGPSFGLPVLASHGALVSRTPWGGGFSFRSAVLSIWPISPGVGRPKAGSDSLGQGHGNSPVDARLSRGCTLRPVCFFWGSEDRGHYLSTEVYVHQWERAFPSKKEEAESKISTKHHQKSNTHRAFAWKGMRPRPTSQRRGEAIRVTAPAGYEWDFEQVDFRRARPFCTYGQGIVLGNNTSHPVQLFFFFRLFVGSVEGGEGSESNLTH